MKSKPVVVVLLAIVAAGSSSAVLAHHSSAMFDREKVVEMKGTVRELQWSNPHIWIQLVTQENGTSREWSLEGGSPNTLSRQGWRSTTFKPGDEVTFRFNPMKDGTPAGAFIGARFADGHTVGRWD